ncbi:MAG TPA: hypothetical protein VJH34_03330 [archaeon]|nr:hypothetical protein [archaeon]
MVDVFDTKEPVVGARSMHDYLKGSKYTNAADAADKMVNSAYKDGVKIPYDVVKLAVNAYINGINRSAYQANARLDEGKPELADIDKERMLRYALLVEFIEQNLEALMAPEDVEKYRKEIGNAISQKNFQRIVIISDHGTS